jgi:hypothetical protein
MKCCSACKFWVPTATPEDILRAMERAVRSREVQNPAVGECRRMPPATVVVPMHTKPAVVTVRWPETLADSWRGEHTARKEKGAR